MHRQDRHSGVEGAIGQRQALGDPERRGRWSGRTLQRHAVDGSTGSTGRSVGSWEPVPAPTADGADIGRASAQVPDYLVHAVPVHESIEYLGDREAAPMPAGPRGELATARSAAAGLSATVLAASSAGRRTSTAAGSLSRGKSLTLLVTSAPAPATTATARHARRPGQAGRPSRPAVRSRSPRRRRRPAASSRSGAQLTARRRGGPARAGRPACGPARTPARRESPTITPAGTGPPLPAPAGSLAAR
jgi:hypothetical protein